MLAGVIINIPAPHSHRLWRGRKTITWISSQPSTINGTELGGQECMDEVLLWCGVYTPDLTHSCYKCRARFSIAHALSCKKVGLVTTHHDCFHDGVAELAIRAFTPSHVYNDPLNAAVISVSNHKWKKNPQPRGKHEPYFSLLLKLCREWIHILTEENICFVYGYRNPEHNNWHPVLEARYLMIKDSDWTTKKLSRIYLGCQKITVS